MGRKPRILLVNEASFLATGFSTYGMEVMKRLYATGKYELAEFASYGSPVDPRQAEFPWKYYGNAPTGKNEQENNLYASNPTNQFGEWKFEEVLLDYQPDIVCDIRDWWMVEYQERSPFRNKFHWALMPTVDGIPQEEQWISTYANADGVFSYTDWGLKVLDIQGGGKINTIDSAPAGVDLEVFRPAADKAKHKEMLGVPPDAFIIGTVMRNQKRKLYDDLIRCFAMFIKKLENNGNHELAKKTFLYLHTSYPDIGWDIPRLIKEHGVAHKTIFTYVCRQTKMAFPSFFQDARGISPFSGGPHASLPNTNFGVDRDALAAIINCFDVYVQYSIAEGLGMPQIEAAACGVPVMSVDYSAMTDVVRKLHGYPIEVARMYRESETHCYRALPDLEHTMAIWQKLINLPKSELKRKSEKIREAVKKHYTWDKTAKKWEEYFDSVELKDWKSTWGSPADIHEPLQQFPKGLSNSDLIKWGFENVLRRPDLVNSYWAIKMIRDLNYGARVNQQGAWTPNEISFLAGKQPTVPFGHNDALSELIRWRNKINHWEIRRSQTEKKY